MKNPIALMSAAKRAEAKAPTKPALVKVYAAQAIKPITPVRKGKSTGRK
jgi:hypothetical protein